MIKKFILVGILFISALLTFSINTRADVGDIEWSLDNPYSTYYAVKLSLDIPVDAYKLSVYIPESDRHLLGSGGINSYVAFKNNGVSVIEYDIPEIKGSQIYGTYDLNLQALGLYGLIDEIVFYIMQDWTSPPDTASYLTGLETATELTFNYNIPYEISVEWYSQYLYSTYYGVLATVDILDNSKTMSLIIPETAFHELLYNGIYATIEFYNASDTKIHVLEFDTDYATPYIGGIHYINLEDLEDEGFSEVPATSYLDLTYFKIFIPQNYDGNIPAGYLDYLTENTSITFNDRVKQVLYMNDGDVYLSELFDLIPSQGYVPTKTSSDPAYVYEFKGWYTADGVEFDFKPVSDDELLDNVFYLYARYEKITTGSYVPDDIVADEEGRLGLLFVHMGWNVSTGYLLSFMIIALIIILSLALMGIPSIAILGAMIALTSIYAFNGFLSLALSIVIYILLAVAFLIIYNGGD